MQTYNSGNVQLSKFRSCVCGLDWNKMSNFHQVIHCNPNRIISRLSLGQSNNKIHTNFFPFPLWYFQGLKQSCGSLMFSFDSLTYIISCYIFCNFSLHSIPLISILQISLHSIPPISILQILIYLGTPGMNRICRLMRFLKYSFLDRFDIRNIDSFPKPYRPILVLGKT